MANFEIEWDKVDKLEIEGRLSTYFDAPVRITLINDNRICFTDDDNKTVYSPILCKRLKDRGYRKVILGGE